MLHHITAQAFVAHALTVMRSVHDAAQSVADEIVPFVTEHAPDALPSFERVLDGSDIVDLAEVHGLLGEGATESEMVMSMTTAHNLATTYTLLAATFGLPKPVNVDEVWEATERMKIIAHSL